MTCDEAQEWITALVDEELLGPERSLLEAHLQACDGCRHALQEERALKHTIRGAGDRIRAPGQLRSRILSDPRIFPDKEPVPRSWQDYLWPLPHPAGLALAVALLLAIALPTVVFLKSNSEPMAVAALETYDRFLKGDLPVHRTENANELVEQLAQRVDGHFHPMGYDLTAMDLRPVAGMVREIDGRKVLVAIYQGKGGTLLLLHFSRLRSRCAAQRRQIF